MKQKLDLIDHGYKTAGRHSCNVNAFLDYLNLIKEGELIDESSSRALSEAEKSSLRNDQEVERKRVTELESEKRKSLSEIDSREKTITRLKQEIEDIKLGRSVEGSDKFSMLKFLINTFLLITLSVYLFLFYVAVIYRSFFSQDVQSESFEGINIGLPAWEYIVHALTTNALIAFAPVIFFSFGYALHVLLDSKGRQKYIYATLIILVTFALDFLLALKGHQQENTFKIMIGEPIESWTTSSIFYIILFMGFVVYIVWSILLHSLISEWHKRDVLGKRYDWIKELTKEIDEQRVKIIGLEGEITTSNQKIDDIQNKIDAVYISVSEIKQSLLQFKLGWQKFGNVISGFEDELAKCQVAFDNFNNLL